MPYNSYIQRGTVPTQTTTQNGAQPLLAEAVSDKIWQGVAEKSAVMSMFTSMRLSTGVTRMPVLDLLPIAYFISTGADTGLKQTTNLAWRNVYINVEEIAVILPIPDNLAADANFDLWEQARPKIEEAIGVALDAAVLFGTNAPTTWPTAVTTAAIAAGNTVTQGTGVDVAADISNVMAAMEADGYNPSGMIHRQDVRASLRNLRSTTNEFIFKDGEVGVESAGYGRGSGSRRGTIFNVPSMAILNGTFEAHNVATANASKLIALQSDQFVLGVRSDITMKKFTEGVIQDSNGDIVFNLMQQDMQAARFTFRVGWACPNPVNRTESTTANRYPASVLRDAA